MRPGEAIKVRSPNEIIFAPDKITTDELKEMFGDSIPMVAVMLLDKWRGDLKDLRLILREIAAD